MSLGKDFNRKFTAAATADLKPKSIISKKAFENWSKTKVTD